MINLWPECRAECQQMGERLQAAYRAANVAVEEVGADQSRDSQSQSSQSSSDDEHDIIEPAVDAFRNDVGVAGTSSDESYDQDHDKHSEEPGRTTSSNGTGSRNGNSETATSSSHSDREGGQFSRDLEFVRDKAGEAAQSAVSTIQKEVCLYNNKEDFFAKFVIDVCSELKATQKLLSCSNRQREVSWLTFRFCQKLWRWVSLINTPAWRLLALRLIFFLTSAGFLEDFTSKPWLRSLKDDAMHTRHSCAMITRS